MRWFIEKSGFGGLTNNNIYRRVVHIKYQLSESAQLIYIGGLSTK